MNWGRVIGGGIAAGIVTFLADFVQHGLILGKTYEKHATVFSQTQANPMLFAAVSVVAGLFIALLFAKTRASWAPGFKGGMAFGLYFGLALFFLNFFYPLVIDAFPYHLAWCWGGIGVIDGLLGGAVLGAIIPRE